ncbi:MAG: hypothetical protein GY718_10175 [Lentisphaerae bacterium]|nr:hypothetical protein [Lentisphaerota bacterium]
MNLATVKSGQYKGRTVNIKSQCQFVAYCEIGNDGGHIFEPRTNLERWASVESVSSEITKNVSAQK